MRKYYVEGDSLPPKSCILCAHWHSMSRQCTAFPDEIPDEIWSGDNPHTEPFDGDNGITFEKLPLPVLAKVS